MEQLLAKALGQDLSQMAAQEKQHLLSRLLARLAHEIRNPLSSLDVHVQLLEEDLAQAAPHLRDRTASRFEIIHGELQRLETLVQQFLNLAGGSSLELQPVDVAKAIRHACALLRPEAEGRGIELSTQLPPDLPLLQADPGQLTQALVNLVINAIQALKDGGRINVAARTEAGTRALTIDVHDTGPGIPVEQATVIFEPYFTTKEDGSGLGLWIVQQIVTAHGGIVSAATAPGGGAVFTLRLPLHGPEAVHG